MEFLYFLLWLAVALSACFTLIWLGLLFSSMKKAIDRFVAEILPVIKEVEKTINSINAELERVDNAFEKIENISTKARSVVQAVEGALSPGLGKIAMTVEALRRGASILLKGKK